MADGEEEAPGDSRCTRADGRSWRCKNLRVDGGGGLCDSHYRQKLKRTKTRVSVVPNPQEGSRKRGRPRKNVSLAKGVGGDGPTEALKIEVEDLKEKDMKMVYARQRKRNLPLKQCAAKTTGNIEVQKDHSPKKKCLTMVDGIKAEDETFLAVGDGHGKGGNGKLIPGGQDLKMKDAEKVYRGWKQVDKNGIDSEKGLEDWSSSVARVLEGFPKGLDPTENLEENPTARKGHQELLPHHAAFENFHEGNIAEPRNNFTSVQVNNLGIGVDGKEDEDAVLAMSPNIGDSAHQQHSLLTQRQPDSRDGPPGPSASTSIMRSGQNKIAGLENLDTGSGAKTQCAKLMLRSVDEFSVSKCAAVLNEMTGFTLEELVKASKVFVKSFNREMFLSLKDELRRVWLRAQISD